MEAATPENPPLAGSIPASAIPLTELKSGSKGLVLRMEEDDHAMLIRLKTMGMHEGRSIRMVRPGSRIIVSCGGTRIGLSAEVARHIRVAPIAS